MKRAARQRLWLVAVLALLAVLVAWTLHRQAPAAPETLLSLDPAEVTHIDVAAHDGAVRRFEKRNGHWWMTAPLKGRADDAHLERLAGIAAAEVLRWRPAAEFDLARIGLAPPFAVVHVDGHELRLGSLAALAPQRYVLLDDHVALIPARYAADITATPDSELARASSSTLPSL
jgi:hypothetical protein